MDINNAIKNFRESLISLWPALCEAKIEPGDDSWDEITECLFQHLVGQNFNNDIGHYAFYSATTESQSNIIINIPANLTVLIGKERLDKSGLSKVVKWNESTIHQDYLFEFRELSEPFDPCKISSLDYVGGEDPQRGLSVAVPFHAVSFSIRK